MAAVFDGDPKPLYDVMRLEADESPVTQCEVVAMVTLRGELRARRRLVLRACY